MAAVAAAAAAAFLGNNRTALMLLDTDYRELYRNASRREDGSSSRGRKTKHNTATRRWIDTVGFPMLAQGRLPDAHDIAMLRSGPRSELRGLARDARDAWSQKHARDPRSKQLTDVEARGQQTLLTWARTNAATVEALTRSTAQRGRPESYKVDFGTTWVGWTPRQLLALEAGSSSARERAMKEQNTKNTPGNYVAWLTNQTWTPSDKKPFDFKFPRHFYTYLALRELENEVSLPWPCPWPCP
tara:strand:+ start:172 stop:900 length:729 start_codon:yes stop_codon:yes gene_type:complete